MYHGFDIGRTKIALGVFDSGRQLQWEKRASIPRGSYDAFSDAVCELIAEAGRRPGCKGSVGIGIPGMPETEDGTLYTANVSAASGKPLRVDLNACFDRDVRLDNDANYFALSKVWDDESTQYPLVMGLIFGTDVGGGLILNGKLITGKSHITGESGHMRLPVDALTMTGLDFSLRRCDCGQYGCIENYLSGRGFVQLYQYCYRQPLQVPEITTFHDQGDEQARVHVKCRLDLLVVCLGNILIIVDPDLVVIGGGLSNSPAITTQPAERLPCHLLPVARVPRTEHVWHGDAGGMCGTVFLHLTD